MTPPKSNFTELKSRTLWYDGSCTISSDEISMRLMRGDDVSNLYVDTLTDELVKYNSNVPHSDKIRIKNNLNELDTSWNIPDKYINIELYPYLCGLIVDDGVATDDVKLRRISSELSAFKANGVSMIIPTLIYIIDVFKSSNIVWGVGRGSCTASYILYLIGLHDVDSIKYDLDIRDFIK